MNISALEKDYPLVYAAALKNRAVSDWKIPTEDIQEAFSWCDTFEGEAFWEAIDMEDFNTAKGLNPELFLPSFPKKYPLGPIKLKLNVNQQISNYEVDIPVHLRKHGSTTSANCTFEIVAYHEDLYIVRVINQHGDTVTQLGYKENMLEPLLVCRVDEQEIECWSVRYSSSFTENMFYAMLNYLTNKYGPYKRSVVKLSWDNFKNDRYGWFWVDSEKDIKFSQDNSRLATPLLSLLDMLKVINYKEPQIESWCVEYSLEFTKPMFDAMVRYCLKKYGEAEKREYFPISWESFTNNYSSYFWLNTKNSFKYSQDNNRQTSPIITLDEMLKIIGYKQGIHVEVIKNQPVLPDLQIRRIQPLRVELKKKEFKQVQIIIKSNHVKI